MTCLSLQVVLVSKELSSYLLMLSSVNRLGRVEAALVVGWMFVH